MTIIRYETFQVLSFAVTASLFLYMFLKVVGWIFSHFKRPARR